MSINLIKMRVPEIVDRYRNHLLNQAQPMLAGDYEDAPRILIDDIHGKIEELKEYLYPKRHDFDASVERPSTLTLADIGWTTLQETILHIAGLVFKDLEELTRAPLPRRSTEQRDTEIAKRQARAAACRRLLRLWMVTGLYDLRAKTNYVYLLMTKADDFENQNRHTKDDICEIIESYQKQLHDWDQRLKKHAKKHLLKDWLEDADYLLMLSDAFGPHANLVATEPGWAQLARPVKSMLHYQAQEARRRALLEPGDGASSVPWRQILSERWDRFWSAVGLWWLWILTKHNTKNARLAFVPLATVFLWSALYFMDDHVRWVDGFLPYTPQWASSSCVAPHSPLGIVGYVMYAINTLTSTNHTSAIPCGPYTQSLATVEGIFGYLSLAILASLLYEYLNKNKL